MYLRRINTRIKHRLIDNIDGEVAAATEVITCHQFMYETTKEAGVWITNNCMGTVCESRKNNTVWLMFVSTCVCACAAVCVCVCIMV